MNAGWAFTDGLGVIVLAVSYTTTWRKNEITNLGDLLMKAILNFTFTVVVMIICFIVVIFRAEC